MWLYGANEGAEKFAIDLGGDGIHIDTRLGEKLACVLDVVDTRGLEGNIGKSGSDKPRAIVLLFERARHATDP